MPVATITPMKSGPEPVDERLIEARLAALELASDERREQLRKFVAEMPAALSRRSLAREAYGELRSATNKGEIARRGCAKLLRAPAALVRRIRRQVP